MKNFSYRLKRLEKEAAPLSEAPDILHVFAGNDHEFTCFFDHNFGKCPFEEAKKRGLKNCPACGVSTELEQV